MNRGNTTSLTVRHVVPVLRKGRPLRLVLSRRDHPEASSKSPPSVLYKTEHSVLSRDRLPPLIHFSQRHSKIPETVFPAYQEAHFLQLCSALLKLPNRPPHLLRANREQCSARQSVAPHRNPPSK